MAIAEKETVRYATMDYLDDRLQYYRNRLDKLEKTIKLLFAALADKKIIGENLAKAFQETKPNNDGLIDWFVERKVPEKEEEG